MEETMGATVRKVDYFYVTLPNTAGQGAKVLSDLAAEGVNLLALTAFPSGRRAQLDLIPDDSAALKRAAKKLGLTLSARKTGFLVQGDDRVGALTEPLDALAKAKINVTAGNAVATGDGRFGALFWVKPESVAKAAKALGAR
jgi:hypothetical protein